jgi:hypothetical protein
MFQWYNSRPSLRKPFLGDLNLRLPAAANTRPPQNTTAAASKTFLQRFQNSLPVGYMTKPKDSFLPPHFLKLLEDTRGGWTPHAHGLFPVSTSPKASRIFYPGLTPPKRTEFTSPLQVTRTFYWEVLHPPRARTAKGIPNLGCNELSDPLLACHKKRPVQRTVTPPERLIFNSSTYSLCTNNKIYLWRMRTVTNSTTKSGILETTLRNKYITRLLIPL